MSDANPYQSPTSEPVRRRASSTDFRLWKLFAWSAGGMVFWWLFLAYWVNSPGSHLFLRERWYAVVIEGGTLGAINYFIARWGGKRREKRKRAKQPPAGSDR